MDFNFWNTELSGWRDFKAGTTVVRVTTLNRKFVSEKAYPGPNTSEEGERVFTIGRLEQMNELADSWAREYTRTNGT